MPLGVDRDYVLEVLTELVACPSVNPTFPGGNGKPGAGESEIAAVAGRMLASLGLDVTRLEETPGRPSVVGVLKGDGNGPTLMLNGHMDTVGPGDMPDAFEPWVEDGRLHGRGAYDMKAGIAACLGAAEVLVREVREVPNARQLGGDLVIALVADEEEASIGTAEVLRHFKADAAIVAEPTELRLCVAHKGFSWIRVTTRGRAAHGSKHEHGIDANLRMASALAGIATLQTELADRPHPELLGPPSLHAALLSGGAGPSIYSARCIAQLERRTLPGETEIEVLKEIRNAIVATGSLAEGDWRLETVLWRPPLERLPGSYLEPIVCAAFESIEGVLPGIMGAAYWTDAALIAATGAEAVLLGPAGAGAHSDVEWVDLESIYRCSALFATIARRFCCSG